MTKFFAYYLLFIYAVAVFRPILPIINDLMAHVLWEHEHLESKHHHDGFEHVDVEIEESMQGDDHDHDTPVVIFSDLLSPHFFTDTFLLFSCPSMEPEKCSRNTIGFIQFIIPVISPPPKN